MSYRQLNLLLLGFLLCSCLFFTFYDLFYERIWWSTVGIYLPCMFLFGYGYWAWQSEKPNALRNFGIILGLVEVGLLGYGSWLWVTGETLWGPVTLGFAGIIGGMLWTVWKALRAKKEMQE